MLHASIVRFRRSFGMVLLVACGMVSASPAFAQTLCRITSIGVFPERIDVTCDPNSRTDPAYSHIHYFALPTADAANAQRMLTALISARTENVPVVIDYSNAAGAGQSYGCRSADCLPINYIRRQ